MRWKTEGLLGSIENCSPQGQTPTSARMRSGCGGRIRSRQGDGSLSAVRQRTVPLSASTLPRSLSAIFCRLLSGATGSDRITGP